MKKITLSLLLLFSISMLQAQVPQSERDALIAIYNALDGPNWLYTYNWNTSQPVSTWTGVTVQTVNGQEHVTGINRRNRNLSGNIPADIQNLPELTYLNLGGNHITGIPNEMENLSNLETIYLYRNELTGNFPSFFANMISLRILNLSSNQLSGIIPNVSGNSNLKYLNISGNDFQFADLEPNFTTLKNLCENNGGEYKYYPMNKIANEESFDAILGNNYTFTMPTVNGTNVSYQWFKNDEAIPGATGLTYTITTAQNSDLGDYTCKASSPLIPDLTIDRNTIHLYGAVNPTDKNALLDLYNSTDGNNWIDHTNWNTNEPVYTWYGITMVGDRVTEINLSDNDLNGTLPSSMGNLSSLKKLNIFNSNGYFSGKMLSGNIPPELGNLNNLEYLDLAYHSLSGNIPPELGNCSALEVLSFWENDLSGTIPTELGNLANLETISLEDNNLTGNIPASFANCTKMGSFWLNGNQLTGDVPDIFSTMPDLYFVSLGSMYPNVHQQLTGTVNLSQNNNLKGVWMSNLDISTIDLRNNNNTAISYLNAKSNPNLTCIFVDDAAWSTANWTDIDANSHFVETQAECDALSSPEFESNLIEIYPNPATDVIQIKNNGIDIQNIKLMNITGQELKLYTGDIQNINISFLYNGIYFLKITDRNGQTGTYKIIKQ